MAPSATHRDMIQPVPLQRPLPPVPGNLLREIRPHQLGPRLQPGIVLAPDDDALQLSVAKGTPAIHHQLLQRLQAAPATQQRGNGTQAQAPGPSVTPLGAPEAAGLHLANIAGVMPSPARPDA